jgi:hypothetical protein
MQIMLLMNCQLYYCICVFLVTAALVSFVIAAIAYSSVVIESD